MADRYFVTSPIVGNTAQIDGPEAHHLLHVMRAKAGDEVVLFDGSGAEFVARVSKRGRSSVELAVLSRAEIDREISIPIIVGVALPKGDRQKWLIEKLTELGVQQVVPLETTRGVSQPVESALERLRRSVVEGSKQCGRNRLMEIASPQAAISFFDAPGQAGPRLFAHPGGVSIREMASAWQRQSSEVQEVRMTIGPEGGFSDAERDAAMAANWQVVDLGGSILRVETAAIALAVVAGMLLR